MFSYDIIFFELIKLIFVSFLIERALSVFFETRLFIDTLKQNVKLKGIKEIIAIITSICVTIVWEFNIFNIIFENSKIQNDVFGCILTGLVIAGGSKASIKIFKDILGFMSSAEKERLKNKNLY